MVIPLGGPGLAGGMPEEEVPQDIKDTHVIFWRLLLLLWLAVGVLRICGLDVLGGALSFLMAFIVHFMVRDNCEKMSQYCLFMFGVICTLNASLELLALASAVGGRVQQTASIGNPSDQTAWKTTYTVSVEKHPFFDPTMGHAYNFQSAVMIVSPICNLIGCALAYWSYHTYPTFMFDDSEGEAAPMGNDWRQPGRGGGRGGGGGAYGGTQPQWFQGGGRRLDDGAGSGRSGGGGSRSGLPPQTRLFNGEGQRLGS